MTEERDAMRIAFVFRSMVFHPADRGLHVLKTRGPAVLGGVSIVDGEPRKLRFGERAEPRRYVSPLARFIKAIFIAATPAAAVDKNRDRVGSVTGRDRSIEQQLFSPNFAVNDIANHLGVDVP